MSVPLIGVFELRLVSYVKPNFKPGVSPYELTVFHAAMSSKIGGLSNISPAIMHSFKIFIIDALAADTFASFIIPVIDGIAIEDKIANTEITTTNSISENPLSVNSFSKILEFYETLRELSKALIMFRKVKQDLFV